ncbi:MAG TPA: Hsp20/alpha crystallin family protein [Pyrinomonadaceae bacterium]
MSQWNPLHDLVSLQDRMNRLFEDASQRRASEAETSELERADWQPLADVYEDESEYTVAIDLPGIDRASLDISIDENRLTVKGTRPAPDRAQHRRETPRGNFLRSFSVPAAVSQKDIRADYKDGVLALHLPKHPERQPQRVKINIS